MGLAILGVAMKALKVPFEIDPTKRTAMVEGEFHVLSAYLRMLILTRIGERVMRPTYGSAVPEALFEPLTDIFEAELDGAIRDAVRTWNPEIEIVSLTFEVIDHTRLNVDLAFRARSNLSGTTSSISVSIDTAGTVEETTQ